MLSSISGYRSERAEKDDRRYNQCLIMTPGAPLT